MFSRFIAPPMLLVHSWVLCRPGFWRTTLDGELHF